MSRTRNRPPVDRRKARSTGRPSTRPGALPRLPDKTKRLPGYSSMLPPVEAGIREIARREGWSRSRVISWLVHDWFRLNPETGEVLRDDALGAGILVVRNLPRRLKG